MDILKLEQALEDKNIGSILNTTHAEIKKKKNDILQKLQIKGVALKTMHATLIGYKYIENFDQLRRGQYIRWISLKRPEKLSLTNGAHICNVNVNYTQDGGSAADSNEDEDEHDDDDEDNEVERVHEDVRIHCKVVRNGAVSFFNLNFDENIIFQKITEQEWVILDAVDYLK
jgi:hypothetical protein